MESPEVLTTPTGTWRDHRRARVARLLYGPIGHLLALPLALLAFLIALLAHPPPPPGAVLWMGLRWFLLVHLLAAWLVNRWYYRAWLLAEREQERALRGR